MRLLRTVFLLFVLVLFGCSNDADEELPSVSLPEIDRTDMRGASDLPDFTRHWQIRISPQAPEPVKLAAEDVAVYFQEMGESAELIEFDGRSTCQSSKWSVDFIGDNLTSDAISLPANGNDQSFTFVEQRCERGRVIRLVGGGLLGRQYAAYEMLHALGVRFFHPEEEYVPESLDLPDQRLSRSHTPDFTWRSVSLHLTHPLELGDAFRLGEEAYFKEAARYIDWQVKNMASYGTGGVPGSEFATYGVDRGFAESAGFALHNQQQGGSRIIDADSPLSEEEQISRAIDERMGDNPFDYPDFFQFTFNPSEFTELPDTDIVRQLTFIANYMAENYPDTQVLATNHGTAGPPTENYGVRFYDLPKFAPENLGVKVHTLMFYDLFRPAPVYGNENFNYLFDFMEEEYQKRQIWHYPEAAWWLTFDIAIPLYLPITIEARDRDIQGIKHMLDGGLDGHRVFGSGHEWGYWQNEYCSFRMAADVDYRWTDCLEDMTNPVMGGAGPEVKSVLEEVVSVQERDFIYDEEILSYLVGTDPETELAAAIGVVFHPLPPSAEELSGWTAEEVNSFLEGPFKNLKRMDEEYAGFVERLAAVEDAVPASGMPWFDEIRDGIQATGLRARHAWQLYGAAAKLRQSRLESSEPLRDEAESMLEEAKATTEEVRSLVRDRERDYRYSRLRSIAPLNEEDEDDNWTVYPYRYLHRTHHVFFYRYVDQQIEELFTGKNRPWEVNTAVLEDGQPLQLQVLDDAYENVSIDLGDSTTSSERSLSHTYASPGVYTVVLNAEISGEAQSVDIPVVVATDVWRAQAGSARLVEPQLADPGLLEGVLPRAIAGTTSGDRGFFGVMTPEMVDPEDWQVLDIDTSAAGFRTVATDISVPIAVGDAVFPIQGGVLDRRTDAIALTGQLPTEAIVQAVVSLTDAFEEEDARALVASTLGYTVETLPERVAFEVVWTLETP